jgi:beta-glucosidase
MMVDATNSGDRDGEEPVQMYIRVEAGSVTRPVKELRGFKKIAHKAVKRKELNLL